MPKFACSGSNAIRSILDSVTQKAARLRRELDGADQNKLSEYLDAIRDVEHRIQTAEKTDRPRTADARTSGGIPETFTDHARMMFDMQVLGLSDRHDARITFMVGREFGGRTYREIGIPEGYHALTHHQYNAEKIRQGHSRSRPITPSIWPIIWTS
jgi:hypothetical protein